MKSLSILLKKHLSVIISLTVCVLMAFAVYWYHTSAMAKKLTINQAFLSAIENAKNSKSPWEASMGLQAARIEIDDKFENCNFRKGMLWRRGCLPFEGRDQLYWEIEKYQQAAVMDSDPAALATVFAFGESSSYFTELKTKHIEKLLNYVQAPRGSNHDGRIFLNAGVVLRDGLLVIRDTSKSNDYLVKAWQAGENWATVVLARNYVMINDYRNAYLWSLRCLGYCNRDADIELRYLQEHLTPEQVLAIQAAAKDMAIIAYRQKTLESKAGRTPKEPSVL